LNQEETIPNPFKYVGQFGVMDEGNGLFYMRARYYDPEAGRFISKDPIGFFGGDINFYAYVANNPVNWIDPEGMITHIVGGVVGGALGGAIIGAIVGAGKAAILTGDISEVGWAALSGAAIGAVTGGIAGGMVTSGMAGLALWRGDYAFWFGFDAALFGSKWPGFFSTLITSLYSYPRDAGGAFGNNPCQ
jgi:RHS repeat-associated protein